MWHLFCNCLFLISSFADSGWLCLVTVAFPGYLKLYVTLFFFFFLFFVFFLFFCFFVFFCFFLFVFLIYIFRRSRIKSLF